MFDYREDFEKLHIRDSFHVYPGLNRCKNLIIQENILEVIDRAERKANEK